MVSGRHRRRSRATLMIVVGLALFLIVLADQMGWTNHG
jgi:hypothetical protein